jgi:FAD-dependent urate hydroxylase
MLTGKNPDQSSVMVIGGGPNGLCAATFLRAAGAEVHTFGIPMESWKEKMPAGMVLRSTIASSNIASPGNALSLEQFERQTGVPIESHPTIEQFISYGEWYQKKGVPNIDFTKVKTVKQDHVGFTTELEDGRFVRTQSIVLATGITNFPYIPEEFASISKQLASHSSEHHAFDQFENMEVVVIGKGQSALESAVPLHECGAKVEIITRGSHLKFLGTVEGRGLWSKFTSFPAIHQFLYPPTDLAGPPNNWAIADPFIYRSLSKIEQVKLFELIGPVGSGYLELRLVGVTVTTRVQVKACNGQGSRICFNLSDGTSREVDHVILATGFRPDINRLDILSNDLKAAIEQVDNYPILSLGYGSISVRGLYLLGSLACWSQGPINRFVCGMFPVGQYLTEAITGSRIGYPEVRTRMQVAGRRLFYQMVQLSDKALR